MFKKILFATTGTPSCEPAGRVAFAMAKRYNANLLAVNVFGIPSKSFGESVTDIKTGKEVALDEKYLNAASQDIKNLYDEQIKKYKDCKIEVVVGIPHTEILRMARKMDVDLIIMGARTEEDESAQYVRHMVGRTLQGVARSARCPVLVIGRPAASFWGGDISNIVFGTDFSKASDSAFLFTLKLAKAFNCSLQFFHAVDVSFIHAGKSISQEEIEDKVRDARARIRKEYVNRLEGFTNYEIEVWEGIPYIEIVKFAREKMADVIVMAHDTKMVDPQQARIGGTMEQVVLRANCPVYSVNRPDKI